MYEVEILVPLKSKGMFPWFQKCQDFTQGQGWLCLVTTDLNRERSSSPKPQNKTKQPSVSGGFLISHSMKASAGNSVVGNRVSCAWNVNKEASAGVQRWLTSGSPYSCHFWVALPCAAPRKHFKWCGRYFKWRSKALCTWLTKISLFCPLFKLLFRWRLY